MYKAAALALAVGISGFLFGCDSHMANSGVRSTYGNIDIVDGWRKAPAPAPKPAPAPIAAKPAAPAPAAPAPAPAPAPQMSGNCMFLPTGDKATSALSLCCQMPREVVAGQNFDYTVEVCNLTGMTLSNVNVAYTIDGAKVVSSDPAMGAGGFAVGDMAPRACKTIKVTANASGVGTVKACMSATWSNALCCGTNVVQPALKITKDVNPKDITPCDTVTYTLTVTNTGTGAASNVKIMDDLPAGVTADSKSALSWDIGTLGAGQSQTRTFVAKAGKTGSYVNHARTSADNGLSATSNDATFTVKAPVLAISKVCPTKVFIGRPSQFKITVSNKGDAPAANTVVEDTLPAGLTFASASDGGVAAGGKVSWNLGTLAAGASKELTINCSGGALGNVQNTASARCTCAEAVTANCSTVFEGVPDIGTSIIDDTGVVPMGAEHVFHYRVRNQGQIDLTNVKMVADLDSGLDFKRSTLSTASAAGSKITFPVGTLKVGQEVVIDIICTGSKTGELVIRTMTTCDQTKDVRNDEQVNYVER
jgi:uncharacterized repeat protein (TIGR01451 family)